MCVDHETPCDAVEMHPNAVQNVFPKMCQHTALQLGVSEGSLKCREGVCPEIVPPCMMAGYRVGKICTPRSACADSSGNM